MAWIDVNERLPDLHDDVWEDGDEIVHYKMAEYIEREATIEKLNKLCDRVCQYSKAQRKYMCGACPLGDAFTVIEDDLPAADVRPVVRGKWKPRDLTWGRSYYYCSACEETVDMPTAMGIPMFRYCPNCGADMRSQPPKEE